MAEIHNPNMEINLVIEFPVDGNVAPNMEGPMQEMQALHGHQIDQAEAMLPNYWARMSLYRWVMLFTFAICVFSMIYGWWIALATNLIVTSMLAVVDYQEFYYRKNKIAILIANLNLEFHKLQLEYMQVLAEPKAKKEVHQKMLRAGMEEEDVTQHEEGVAAIQAKYGWLKKDD